MRLLQLFDPEKAVKQLKVETISLVKQAKEVKTMKDLIVCFDILQITDEINDPWVTHTGFIYADKAAFQDLYTISGTLMIYADPSREALLPYVYDVKRLLLFWKMQDERGKK